MGVLAHHPELTTAYNQLIRHALYFTTITPRQRELLVLRVAHLRRCSVRVGCSVYQSGGGRPPRPEEEVARVRLGPDAPGWPPLEQALAALGRRRARRRRPDRGSGSLRRAVGRASIPSS